MGLLSVNPFSNWIDPAPVKPESHDAKSGGVNGMC